MQATTIATEQDGVEVLYRPRSGAARRLTVTLDPREGPIARVGGKRVWLEADRLEPAPGAASTPLTGGSSEAPDPRM